MKEKVHQALSTAMASQTITMLGRKGAAFQNQGCPYALLSSFRYSRRTDPLWLPGSSTFGVGVGGGITTFGLGLGFMASKSLLRQNFGHSWKNAGFLLRWV